MSDVKLHKPREFDKRFDQHLKECNTYIQAYQLTEKDFKQVFGERKYASYNSFRNSYNSRKK